MEGAKHVAGESFDPGSGSWAYRATQDVQRMFELRYIPAGDIVQRYGIDTKSGPITRPGQLPSPWTPQPRSAGRMYA